MKKIKEVLIFSGAYAAGFIGVGVASGQEIMQYFTNHGSLSYAAILVFLVVSMFICSSIMGLARLEPSATTFRFYFGDKVGWLFDKIIIPVMCFLMGGVLLCGAGAIAESYFGISSWIGVGAMAAMIFVSYIIDLQKLVDVLGALGPLLIVISIAVCLISLINAPDFGNYKELIEANPHAYVISGKWWWGAIQFAVVTPSLGMLFFGKIASGVSSYKTALAGGAAGSLMLAAAFLVMNAAFIGNYSFIADSSVPTIDLVARISPTLAAVYGVIVFLALYTTIMPAYWTVCSALPTSKNKKGNTVFPLIIAIIYIFAGQLPFGQAMNFIYPYVGTTCTVIAAAVLTGVIRYRIQSKRGKGEIEQ